MRLSRSPASVVSLALVALGLGCSAVPEPVGLEVTADQKADLEAIASIQSVNHKNLCGPAEPGQKRCFAKVVTDEAGNAIVNAAPKGLGAQDIQAAYALPTSGGNGRIVAVVDAFDAPNAERDLGMYRSQFGLPPCTTANGCFQKVNQSGQASPLPKADSGWAGEIALDLDMVSAACPDCKILLVEANSAGSGLAAAVAIAGKMGASAITNSYGGPESGTTEAKGYDIPGVLVTASTGDDGYGVSSPASAGTVLAVGGTSLTKSTSTRGWAEKAWSKAGSGCSRFIDKPSFQTDTICTKRVVGDVSAVADPATGVALYDGGWQTAGGTSASSPIVAAAFTLLNLTSMGNAFPYANTSAFFDVTSGSNGSCGGNYQCTAGPGYDGPTGVGTPNGAALSGGVVRPPPPADAGQTTGAGGATAGAGGAGGGTGGPSGATGTGGRGTGGVSGATGATTTTGGAAGTSSGAGGVGGGDTSGGVSSTVSTGSTGGAGGDASSSASTGSSGGATTATVGSTSSTGAAGTTSGAGGAMGGPAAKKPVSDLEGGCSCRMGVASRSGTSAYGTLLALALGLAAARRRRVTTERIVRNL